MVIYGSSRRTTGTPINYHIFDSVFFFLISKKLHMINILSVSMIQLAALFCPLEYQKIRILQDYELWDSQIDLPSIQPAILQPITYLCDSEQVFQQPYGEVLLSPISRKIKLRLREV